MSLYPSLEDMEVDHMAKAQIQTAQITQAIEGGAQEPPAYAAGGLYAGLGLEEMMSFAGLDISEGALTTYMPQEVANQVAIPQQNTAIVSVTSPGDQGIIRAQVKQGVRQVILAKDQEGKIGVAVQSIDKGLFVAFVWQNSAAALAGVRFGDQILQINGEVVAGWTQKQALEFLRKANSERITMAIRDRPFERTITVQKDANNQIGFIFKKGEITAIVKESSAARNGLLINHCLVEVNGQNVVGLKDEEILAIMKESPRTVTVTVMPTFMFQHLVKKIGFSKIKKYMDHSIPEV